MKIHFYVKNDVYILVLIDLLTYAMLNGKPKTRKQETNQCVQSASYLSKYKTSTVSDSELAHGLALYHTQIRDQSRDGTELY